MCPYPSGKAWELSLLQGFVESMLGDIPDAPSQVIKLFLQLTELFWQGQGFAQRFS